MKEDTRKYRVAKALYDHDDEPTARELKRRLDMPGGSVDSSLRNLREDDYVRRRGDGGRSDPYRHHLTDKGRAAVESNGPEPDGPTGLDALGFGDSAEQADVANDGGSTTEPIPSSGETTFVDRAFDVTYSTEEVVDLLLALGDADEPDFDTRREFARTLLFEMRREE